jgi:hypothetical protein
MQRIPTSGEIPGTIPGGNLAWLRGFELDPPAMVAAK